ncbi:hypothetical protein DOK76_07905 [Vagococcus sp. DIV0080]|uniref:Uncharacterized protein n=1 Tax=Candidatus Vagococcus giribetii TaxID=2230876 RepID=A0ABS3HUF1_9ENTE|nr:SpaA isopeptide-forming pilin-related protein [Vagococcus sp. DIV0080]MBO0476990.1 hypothetical protein [Vagococcus sp. DIV0080]
MKKAKNNTLGLIVVSLLFCLGTVGFIDVLATSDVQGAGSFYTDVPEAEQSLLGAASYFHIFANKAHLANHTNGNVATKELSGSANFGTQGISWTEYDYAQQVLEINGASGIRDHTKMVFGKDTQIDLSEYNRPKVNGRQMDRLSGKDVYQDKGSNVYIDFNHEFARLEKVSNELIATEASHVYYNKDFKNENEREIDVSNLAGPDVYIRLAPEVLKLNTPLTIKGLEKNQGDGNFKNVYVIIETDSASSYNVQSQIKFKYTDGTERGNKETTDFSDNTLLWTFSYNNQPFSGDIYLGSTWLGSILAPLASLGGSQNIDGNIIVDHFKGAGETHGWNFQENKKGRVVLRKTSSIDGTKLAGAVFDLYQEGKEEPIKTDLTTDANGEIYVNDLKVGRYYFKETKAPDGYELSDKKIPFEITADTLKELTVVGVTNDKTPEEPEFYLGEVRVRKMDAIDTADRLKGAVFALYKVEDGKKDVLIDGNLTTNDKGEVVKTKLKEGSYYFQEVKAPDGYEKSDKKYPFEITKEFIKNKIDILVDVPNKKIPELGSVVIIKTDQEDDSLFLAGAEFSLFKKDGTEIATGLTTNAEGKLTYKNLLPGSYYFVETKAPAGYEQSNKKWEFEIEKGKITEERIVHIDNHKEEILDKGSVTLKKIDSQGKNVLSGAQFSLYTESGEEIAKSLETNEQGILTVTDLAFGSYYFKENKAPTGYELSTQEWKFTIGPSEVSEPILIVAENTKEKEPEKGSVVLTKVDGGNQDVTLASAMFTLYKESGELIQDNLTTNEQGVLRVDDLEVGSYYFIETKAPDGYSIVSKKHSFDIKEGSAEEVVMLQATNDKEVYLGSVVLRKTDQANNQKVLSGAEYSLFKATGELVQNELVTDSRGEIQVTNLAEGDYYFVETKAPVGYELSTTPYEFTIKAKETSEVVRVEATNIEKIIVGAVQLTKVDVDNPSMTLDGAEFSLFKETGELVADQLTTKNGIIVVNELPLGSYYFVETKAPENYQLSTQKYRFDISETNYLETIHIQATNKITKKLPELGGVKLIKVDKSDPTILLSGAEFSLYHEDGSLLQDGFTTNELGVLEVTQLEVGSYYFVETKAPVGYEKSNEKYGFDIKENETSVVQQVKVTNEKVKEEEYLGSVKLIKTDKTDSKKYLKGAEFSLFDKANKLVEKNLVTNDEGFLVVENLKEGSYYFIETKAPAGYEKTNEKYAFDIKKNETSTVQQVHVTNRKVPVVPKTPSVPGTPNTLTSKYLPKTGEASSSLVLVGWTFLLVVFFLYWKERRYNHSLD